MQTTLNLVQLFQLVQLVSVKSYSGMTVFIWKVGLNDVSANSKLPDEKSKFCRESQQGGFIRVPSRATSQSARHQYPAPYNNSLHCVLRFAGNNYSGTALAQVRHCISTHITAIESAKTAPHIEQQAIVTHYQSSHLCLAHPRSQEPPIAQSL